MTSQNIAHLIEAVMDRGMVTKRLMMKMFIFVKNPIS